MTGGLETDSKKEGTMIWMRAVIVVSLVLLGGCYDFSHVGFIPAPPGLPDLATPPDLAELPDLASPPDLAELPDLATPPDLAELPDLATPPDLVALPDLATPPDLAELPDLTRAADLARSPDLIVTWPVALNGFRFHRVAVKGKVTDTAVAAACKSAGLKVPCASAVLPCKFVDAVCLPTLEDQCARPMDALAQAVGCPAGAGFGPCAPLERVCQYMGHGLGVDDNACCLINGKGCLPLTDGWALCVETIR